MAKQLQLRKGTATEHDTFTGANGEVTVDTTNKTLRVHDGSTVGGIQLATVTGGSIPSAQLPVATTSTQGIVKLNNTLTSTSATEALTAAQGKLLKDTLDTTVSSSLGVGQTWQDVTSSRSFDTSYTNNTGRPIQVAVTSGGGSSGFKAYINGIEIIRNFSNYNTSYPQHGITLIIPNGSTYSFTGGQLQIWAELR